MTTVGLRLRQSPYNNAFDIGVAYFRKFAFYTGSTSPDGTEYAADLSVYDTLALIVFDASNVKIDKFTLTLLTATAEKEADPDGVLVSNKITCTVLPTGSAGDYFWHIVGTVSSVPHQLSQPAKVGYYAAPPVT